MSKCFAVVVSLVCGLVLAACSEGKIERAADEATPATSVSGIPTDTYDPVVDEPTEEPTDVTAYSESKFGEAMSFTQGDSGTFAVRLDAPRRATCQYQSIGCDRPDTGDRVITTTATIRNTGTEPIEVDNSLFVLEFADGTRMEAGEGSASDYQPDNSMDWGHKIRPGATYKSTLTFEAPRGRFSIIMLTGTWDSEDLHGWV
jgi:hypothetical protein